METSLNAIVSQILTAAAKRRASNIHLIVGAYPTLRIDDELVELKEEPIITESFMKKFVDVVLSEPQKEELAEAKEISFIKDFAERFRFKVSIFYQKQFLSASLKMVSTQIPLLVNLGLPKVAYSLTDKRSGLIIIAGPYGSGRTTTAAAMIEEINKSRKENIVTIEKPIEYLFVNNKSLIEQREVGRDVNSFLQAVQYLKDADIDVMAISINDEPGVIQEVLEFANSGRLAILQMDTTSTIQTIEEIISSFKSEEKDRARLLLSDSLRAIICQRLVPRIGGGLALATEILISNDAISSLIREARVKQIITILQSSREEGMLTLDQSLADLVKSGEVLIDKAVEYADDPRTLRSMAKSS